MKTDWFLFLLAIPFFTPAQVARTPPMGWNSYDCFGAAVRETEVKANAQYMASHLKDAGYEYMVVDYCWYYPLTPGCSAAKVEGYRKAIEHCGRPVVLNLSPRMS